MNIRKQKLLKTGCLDYPFQMCQKMIGRIFFALTLLIIIGISAHAGVKLPHEHITPAIVSDLENIARKNITKAVLPDGSNIPPETKEERKKPIISPVDAYRVVRHGAYTGTLDGCGLPGDEKYHEFMRSQRKMRIFNDKQMSYIGLLHGVARGVYGGVVKEIGCDNLLKSAISQAAPY